MLKPTYTLTLGGTILSPNDPASLAALHVRRAKNGGADEALVVLGRVPAATVAEGDPASIELGWDGSTELVFTGTIEAVDNAINRIRVHCLGLQAKLMKLHEDRTFINQTAGQVVTALAGDAGLATDTVQDGLDLPVYLADSSVGLHEHCRKLASTCGFDFYSTETGDIVFAEFSATGPDHTFKFGEHILSASVEKGIPLDEIAVTPESPASSSGDDTSPWLIKDPSSHVGTAGGGSFKVLLSDPLLRTKDGAEKAAKAKLYFSRRDSVSGFVELMGAPQVKLGQAVCLEGVPKAGVDGTYQVMAVRHLLAERRGFRTVVTLGGMP